MHRYSNTKCQNSNDSHCTVASSLAIFYIARVLLCVSCSSCGSGTTSGGEGNRAIFLMFYDKGGYATWGNFPSGEWILVNIMITTK